MRPRTEAALCQRHKRSKRGLKFPITPSKAVLGVGASRNSGRQGRGIDG